MSIVASCGTGLVMGINAYSEVAEMRLTVHAMRHCSRQVAHQRSFLQVLHQILELVIELLLDGDLLSKKPESQRMRIVGTGEAAVWMLVASRLPASSMARSGLHAGTAKEPDAADDRCPRQ